MKIVVTKIVVTKVVVTKVGVTKIVVTKVVVTKVVERPVTALFYVALPPASLMLIKLERASLNSQVNKWGSAAICTVPHLSTRRPAVLTLSWFCSDPPNIRILK